jgi:hypothetical protein
LFQSIYTSLLTNEINPKRDNKKKSRKINFKGETNRIGKEKKEVEEEREGKGRRKTIKERSKILQSKQEKQLSRNDRRYIECWESRVPVPE